MTEDARPTRLSPTFQLVRLEHLERLGETGSANDRGAPVSDEYVARALAAMKADPARRWTLGALARVAGLSRAPFARRFRRAMGQTPLRWLAEHRVRLAQALLATSAATLAEVAAAVGYSSEFALSKAFKRLLGIAPTTFRREVWRGTRPWTAPIVSLAA